MKGVRTGFGLDVHAFGGPGPIILGGVAIDNEIGLVGHSDGDVLAHAIADALLGAAALGDIGRHFLDTDPKWSGADSLGLLATSARMVVDAGWQVCNVDSVVVCETPRIGPHREEMRSRLAAAMRVDVAQVEVKATTTEALGFLGRGEGIAAQAIATIGK